MTATITLEPPPETSTGLRPATVEKWLEALESGRYPKTKDRLRDDTGFCCLGVAADLEGAGWIRPEDMASVCPAVNEFGVPEGSFGVWFGAEGGELADFLRWRPDYRGQVADQLAEVNDSSDTFAPVVARARELHTLWLEDRRARHGPDTPRPPGDPG